MEGCVRDSDGARGGTHINFPIHGEDEQSETNTAGGEAETQEIGAVNGGGQQSQSGAPVFGIGTGNDEQIAVQSGAPRSGIVTLNDEEPPALSAATGFAVGAGNILRGRYAQLFNLDELRRSIVITDDEDEISEEERAIHPRILEEETDEEDEISEDELRRSDPIVITDDEDEIREEERAIHPRILEEETDEEDDELIEMMFEYMCDSVEMMFEYMCDRVEMDEVTHEEEAEKPTCAICIEGLHFVEEDGNENGDGNRTLHRLPCSHVFHSDCISKWFRTSFTCPLCRTELPPP